MPWADITYVREVQACLSIYLLYLWQHTIFFSMLDHVTHCWSQLGHEILGIDDVNTACEDVFAAQQHVDQQLLLVLIIICDSLFFFVTKSICHPPSLSSEHLALGTNLQCAIGPAVYNCTQSKQFPIPTTGICGIFHIILPVWETHAPALF